jgi:hypothetical protein
MSWKSKYKYSNDKGIVGNIEYSESQCVYYIRNSHGFLCPINQDMAKKIRETEERLAPNHRPALFPNAAIEAHSISLPKELWTKLRKPYSCAIAELIYDKKD